MRTTKSWFRLILVLFALSVSFVAVPASGIVFYDSLGNVCCFHEDNQEIEKIDFQKADKDAQEKSVFMYNPYLLLYIIILVLILSVNFLRLPKFPTIVDDKVRMNP